MSNYPKLSIFMLRTDFVSKHILVPLFKQEKKQRQLLMNIIILHIDSDTHSYKQLFEQGVLLYS